MTSLEAAFERLNRAKAHIDELKAIAERFREEHSNPMEFEFHDNIPENVAKVADRDGFTTLPVSLTRKDVPLPDGIRALVGEIIQSTRIPLDYLIYELAHLDSGAPQEGTQFPIFWKRSYFRKKEPVYLCGVNAAHRHAIELLQPYNGGRWLGRLASLSNPDKHKTRLQVRNSALMSTSGTIRSAQGSTGHEVEMNFHFVPQITLDDGKPVVEAIEEFECAVRAVIDEFNACFEGACDHSAPPTVQRGDPKRSRQGRRARRRPSSNS